MNICICVRDHDDDRADERLAWNITIKKTENVTFVSCAVQRLFAFAVQSIASQYPTCFVLMTELEARVE